MQRELRKAFSNEAVAVPKKSASRIDSDVQTDESVLLTTPNVARQELATTEAKKSTEIEYIFSYERFAQMSRKIDSLECELADLKRPPRSQSNIQYAGNLNSSTLPNLMNNGQ
jgi:hypothetical protein